MKINAKRLYRDTKRNALKRGISFEITFDQIERKIKLCAGLCQKTGLPFMETNGFFRNPYAPSIDRIHSSEGYTLHNIRIVCVCVNNALNEWGDGVFNNMVKYGYASLNLKPKSKFYNASDLRKEFPKVSSNKLTKKCFELVQEGNNDYLIRNITNEFYLTESGFIELKSRLNLIQNIE
jgi:hypothetical protein